MLPRQRFETHQIRSDLSLRHRHFEVAIVCAYFVGPPSKIRYCLNNAYTTAGNHCPFGFLCFRRIWCVGGRSQRLGGSDFVAQQFLGTSSFADFAAEYHARDEWKNHSEQLCAFLKSLHDQQPLDIVRTVDQVYAEAWRLNRASGEEDPLFDFILTISPIVATHGDTVLSTRALADAKLWSGGSSSNVFLAEQLEEAAVRAGIQSSIHQIIRMQGVLDGFRVSGIL